MMIGNERVYCDRKFSYVGNWIDDTTEAKQATLEGLYTNVLAQVQRDTLNLTFKK